MKLLLIEDEVKINQSLAKGLTHEGFIVESAFDGKVGLEKFESNTYDAVILDIMLPYIDGISILQTVRKEKILTPVIILSAKDQVYDKVKGIETGADDYLAKPFSFQELLVRIKALIRRTTMKGNTMHVGNLEIDPYKHIVTRSEKTISLSSKEFLLLEYLVKNKSAILSEMQILENVWPEDFEYNSNVVAVHIKNLRQKIDKAFSHELPLIHTIRGVGYKIDG